MQFQFNFQNYNSNCFVLATIPFLLHNGWHISTLNLMALLM